MPSRTSYAPGTPAWVDIGTDVEAAKVFYGELFGWAAAEMGPPEETGGYGFFLKDDKMVAGYGPQQNPGPPAWSTYIWVTDADDTAAKVTAAGGAVVVAPMDVMAAGRMAVFTDPEGAFISVWQPGEHHGAELVNEPGSVCWNELSTRDVDGAKQFYGAVFGWDSVTHTDGPFPYTEAKVGASNVAGMMPMMPMIPAEVPAHWLTYFAVDDADAVVEQAKRLGGAMRMPMVLDLPVGRVAILIDPQGASFGVIALSNPAA